MLPHGPTDRYTPAAGTATCPYCAAEVAGVGVPAAASFATFAFNCPACGQAWKEIRDHDAAEARRYYERAATAEQPA